jgi:hypothetical protein
MMNNCLILGCGRSGTSMLAGLLSADGYYQGDDYIAPDSANPKGFFEDREVNQINEEILAAHLDGDRVQALLDRLLGRTLPKGVRWLARPRRQVSAAVSEEIRRRIEERVSRRPFCYKDPRLCFTLPAWMPLLPEDTRFIVIFRDPVRTAKSILKRKAERPYARSFRMTFRDAGEVWYSAYQHVLRSMKNERKYLFVHFEDVLNGNAWDRLRTFLDVRVNESFPDHRLASTVTDPACRIPRKWREMYQRLQDLSQCSCTAVV